MVEQLPELAEDFLLDSCVVSNLNRKAKVNNGFNLRSSTTAIHTYLGRC